MAIPGGKRAWLGLLAAGGLGGLACSTRIPLPLVGSSSPPPDTSALEVGVWRAGRTLAPGLSGARAGELEAERGRALERLDASWSPALEATLARWLSEAETRDELWCAAARVVAELGRYELAGELGSALDAASSPARASGARSALHRLFGRWFRDRAELEPYLASVAGGPGTSLLLEANRWEEQRSRERLLGHLAHEHGSAVAWLADPDPEVRAGAARLLGQVFRTEGADWSGTLAALVAHLESEFHPQAFHDGLEASLVRLEGLAIEDPSSMRLRAVLLEIARSEGEARTLSAARALARLPWRHDGPRDLGHLLTGVDLLGAMLRGLSAADRVRGVNDPDPLVAVLGGLREVSARASAAGLGAELSASVARESLFEVLGDPLQDEAVRAAAAAAVGPLVRAEDGGHLARVLADPAVGAPVKHALLGSLRAVLAGLDPLAQGSTDLLEAVAELSGASDSDLRRRALSLLADPRFEPLVRALDPAFLVERLESEPGREAALELLGLLQRFARPGQLEPLLAAQCFDRLCADPVLLERLADVLASLVAGSGRDGSGSDTVRVALRLASAQAEETRLARLRRALVLVAGLDPAAAAALERAEHAALVDWVSSAIRAGVSVRDLAPAGLAFEHRLLELHLPRAADPARSEPAAFEHLHLVALLRADLFLGGSEAEVGRGTKQQVEAAFESAQSLAASPELRLLVLRDRARFRAAANERVKALSDYRRLFEAGESSDALIAIPDLRCAVELLGRLDEASGPERSASAGEACDLLERLVARGAWRAEPASVRMQDLRDWVRAALDSGSAPRLRQLETALADLPLTQLEAQAEREPAPLWSGLTRDADWFQELLDLRAQVRIGLRAIGTAG